MGKITVYRADELINVKINYEPIIEGFLFKGDVLLIKAQKKEGKSVLSQQIAFSLSSGSKLFDALEVYGSYNIAYISGEGYVGNWKDRYVNMLKMCQADINRIYFIEAIKLALNTDAGGEVLLARLASLNVNFDIIFYDPIYRFLVNGDYSSTKDMGCFFNNVEMIQKAFNATSIIIHHDSEKEFVSKDGKKHKAASDNTGLGASLIGMAVTHWYTLSSYKDENKRLIHQLRLGPERAGGMIEKLDMFMIKPQEDDLGRLGFTLDYDTTNVYYNTLCEFMKKHKKVSTYKTFNHKELQMNERTFYLNIKRLKDKNLIDKEIEDNNKQFYIWKGD